MSIPRQPPNGLIPAESGASLVPRRPRNQRSNPPRLDISIQIKIKSIYCAGIVDSLFSSEGHGASSAVIRVDTSFSTLHDLTFVVDNLNFSICRWLHSAQSRLEFIKVHYIYYNLRWHLACQSETIIEARPILAFAGKMKHAPQIGKEAFWHAIIHRRESVVSNHSSRYEYQSFRILVHWLR